MNYLSNFFSTIFLSFFFTTFFYLVLLKYGNGVGAGLIIITIIVALMLLDEQETRKIETVCQKIKDRFLSKPG